MFKHWISWGLEHRYRVYWITLIAAGLLFKIPHYIFILTRGRLCFGIYVKGQENMRTANGPLVVIENHESFFDPFITLTAIPWRSHVLHVRALTAPWLFTGVSRIYTFIRAGLWFLGAIPALREKTQTLSKKLEAPERILNEGNVVFIDPEGGFSPDERLHEFHAGAAYLALRTDPLILPIALRGACGLTQDNLLTIKAWREILFERRVVTINFGKPFHITPRSDMEHLLAYLDRTEREGNHQKIHEVRHEVLGPTLNELWDILHNLYHDPVPTPGRTNPIDYTTCICKKS